MGVSRKILACYVNFVLLLVTMIILYVSGFVLWRAFPQGRAHGKFSSNTFLGLTRDYWMNIHVFAGFGFLVLTIIHLVLNWGWIRSVTRCLLVSSSKRSS